MVYIARGMARAQRMGERLTKVMRIRMTDSFHADFKQLSVLSGREMSDIARPILQGEVRRRLRRRLQRRRPNA